MRLPAFQNIQTALGTLVGQGFPDAVRMRMDWMRRRSLVIFLVFSLFFSLSGRSQSLTAPEIGNDQVVCPNALPKALKVLVQPKGGVPPYAYQWQLSTDEGTTWGNIDGANSATYQPEALIPGAKYVLLVVDSDNPRSVTTSNKVSISAAPPIVFLSGAPTSNYNGYPLSGPKASDGEITLKATGGVPPLKYTLNPGGYHQHDRRFQQPSQRHLHLLHHRPEWVRTGCGGRV